ncbi:ABC transporter permease [Paludibacter jiangxiensis]|uniref:ABC-2 type transport system permease protein n=1 Tax=Paludibacter jiangxiensis TaxID=681398 RepID=A0A161LUH4_9BACT|nr:ABC transporter permease [Paludibacter jiangxiensis]GAT62629.1 ABC-2 type transport system permease protein [Paludibacter jiangxiensis]
MNKIGIIIRREYTTRVAKKSFIIMTFLSPLLFAALIMVPLWLSGIKDNESKKIAVVDFTNEYGKVLKSDKQYVFVPVQERVQNIGNSQLKKDFYAVLLIKGDLVRDSTAATLYSEKQVGIELESTVSRQLSEYVENKKLDAYHVANIKQMVEKARTKIDVTTIKLDEKGNSKVTSSIVATIIGGLSTFLIYMFIFMYGVQVMRGVVEEKTNRIVEVIISSVKPFELMMGKIIGIALVGLTQFLLWIVLTLIISNIAGFALFGTSISNLQAGAQLQGASTSGAQQAMMTVFQGLQGINLVEIVSYFIFYFLGGYLLYASLFAAVGSAVDNETDTQQFMMPITIPILFAFYAAIYSIENPDGPLAFWCSLIPFTSPIVMMVRLPFDVPLWEKLLSVGLLVITFIGTTWLAGKIYRTGILMYGKKPSWKEMWKWLRYKN